MALITGIKFNCKGSLNTKKVFLRFENGKLFLMDTFKFEDYENEKVSNILKEKAVPWINKKYNNIKSGIFIFDVPCVKSGYYLEKDGVYEHI